MLKIIHLQSSAAREQLLEKFDPKVSSWIVSDQQSKLQLKKHLLQQHTGFEGEALLRARELWALIARRQFPGHQVLSREMMLGLAKDFVKNHSIKMGQNSDAVLVSAVSYFAQVLLHPEGHQQLVEEFKDSNWILWLNLASDFLN